MKNVKLSVLLFVSVIMMNAVFGQQFDGVNISGNLSTVVAKYKEKGYKFVESDGDAAFLTGKVGTKPIELYIFSSPKSRVVYRVQIFFSKKNVWDDLTAEFDYMLDVLEEKYGQKSTEYKKFDKPYYEGDGYEMTALGADKVTWKAFWLNKVNTSVMLEISSYKQVSVTIENQNNYEIYKRERQAIEKSAF